MGRLNIKIDDDKKERAKKLFEAMGMSLSTAMKVFINQSLHDGGLPFKPTVNNQVKPAKHYIVKTPHGFERVEEFARHSSVSNDKLIHMILAIPSNVKSLKRWAQADINSDELECIFGRKVLHQMTHGTISRYAEMLPRLNTHVIDKKRLSKFRAKEIIKFMQDGNMNQRDLDMANDDSMRLVEIKCLLIDYMGARLLNVTNATLGVTFHFVNH